MPKRFHECAMEDAFMGDEEDGFVQKAPWGSRMLPISAVETSAAPQRQPPHPPAASAAVKQKQVHLTAPPAVLNWGPPVLDCSMEVSAANPEGPIQQHPPANAAAAVGPRTLLVPRSLQVRGTGGSSRLPLPARTSQDELFW